MGAQNTSDASPISGSNMEDEPIVSIKIQINNFPISGCTTAADVEESSRKLRGIRSGD